MDEDFGILECEPGLSIDYFAAELVAQAYEQNRLVLGSFNQHTLEARPGNTREDIVRQWDEAQQRTSRG